MKREEQIRQASIEYTMENAPKCIGGDAFSEVMNGMNRNHVFEEGAKWADENPRTPWINVNDSLPNDETKLYIIYCEAYNKNGDDIENKHHEIYLANFDKEISSWSNVESYNNYFFDVLYWMPIPEPPKE